MQVRERREREREGERQRQRGRERESEREGERERESEREDAKEKAEVAGSPWRWPQSIGQRLVTGTTPAWIGRGFVSFAHPQNNWMPFWTVIVMSLGTNWEGFAVSKRRYTLSRTPSCSTADREPYCTLYGGRSCPH